MRFSGSRSHATYNRDQMPTALFRYILVVHVTLAISLFVPAIVLPFTLRARRATTDSNSPVIRFLLWMQGHGTIVIGLGLALTGLAMVAILTVPAAAGPAVVDPAAAGSADPRSRDGQRTRDRESR